MKGTVVNTDKLKSLAISDTGFIFDPATGYSFSSNVVGISIINALKAGMDSQEITALLLDTYDVAREELEADVSEFIQSMREHHLI